MDFELLYSALTLFLIGPLLLITRRTIAFVFLLSISIFVIGLPWLRWIVTGNSNIEYTQGGFAKYAAMLLFSLGVVAVSLISKQLGAVDPQWMRRLKNNGIDSSTFKYSVAVLLVVWLLRIYRASSYGILFSGSDSEAAIADQGYYFVIVISLVDMMALGALYYLIVFSAEKKYIAWILIGAEISWTLISSGRRNFIFILALILFVKFIAERRNRVGLLILVSISGYLLVDLISPIFLYSRSNVLNYLASGDDAFSSVVFGISDALTDLWSEKLLSQQVLNENLWARGDVGTFLDSIISALSFGSNYLFGDALGTSFAWAVPSFLVGKPILMVEQYIQSRLGMPLGDDAVSWLAVAYADFGMIGCFIYGALFIGCASLLIYFTSKTRSNMLYMIGSVQACYVSYSVEADPLLLFASLRNISILIFCYQIFRITKADIKRRSRYKSCQ